MAEAAVLIGRANPPIRVAVTVAPDGDAVVC